MQQQYKNEITSHQQDINKFTKLLSEKEANENQMNKNNSNLEAS